MLLHITIKKRLTLIVLLLIAITVMITYRISSEELAAKASFVDKPALETQAFAADAAEFVPLGNPVQVYEDAIFGYQVSYPVGWDVFELRPNVMALMGTHALYPVQIEVVGPLAEDLTTFVNRSLGDTPVITRQDLTIHGATAQRIITRDSTTFYINTAESAYIVSSMGEPQAVEMIARSFTAP